MIWEPLTAMVKLDFRGVERHNASRCQAGCISMDSLKVVEPEANVHFCRIIFCQVQLSPSHGPIKPAIVIAGQERGGTRLSTQKRGNRLFNKFPASCHLMLLR